ncbi:MAG: DNA primase small subunit domain-containing protein [Thermoplasmatota archaeon]
MSDGQVAEARPEFPPPVKATIDWLQRRFGAYYKASPPPMPDRFTRREFGFILWPERPGPPPFVRHRAYTDGPRFQDYLGWRGPHSIYYSTAYYRAPGERRMVDKDWMGAELIFDLDADHLVEAEAAKAQGREMPLADQLALVKRQFVRLLDEFLFGDLGLGENDLFITFSGGRGYHAHVTHRAYQALDAKARREIVDYVTGKVPAKRGSDQPDVTPYLQREAVQVRGQGKFAKAEHAYRLAPADAPGWPGRLTRTLAEMVQEHVIDAGPAAGRSWLLGLDGVGPKTADGFLAKMERMGERSVMDLLVAGRISHRGDPLFAIAEHALTSAALPLARGETDEPVTADVKRLIRLPGSLHGKTGLRVVTMSRSELDDFEPLRDAVAFDLDQPVGIVPRFDQEVSLGGERVAVTAGDEVEVPEPHAVFWCSRQAGSLAGPPGGPTAAPGHG